jgi:thioredoxin 1
MKLHRTVSETYEQDVVIASAIKPVIVKYTAAWCGPCKTLTPILEKLADEQDGVSFVEIDIENDPVLLEGRNISSVPTTIVYVNGEEKKRILGAKPKQALEMELASFFS